MLKNICKMPYETNDSLPEAVQKYLPKHAQDIYREAFNHAYETYKDASKRHEQDDSVKKISHRVAWSAVKNKYEKDSDDIWRKKEEIIASKSHPDQPKKT